ncbi:glycosyltransferase [Curtobacterium sp. ISL-83]|uniref:glycosyltransferase n=1 Tax=Curtobacterium sp. ISL-83 TaxID=2819145 RepID=UPI001BE57BF5|nr:glycosyltransferase [Curtobacterium sp. ISL-83]MBT2502634.1 glycosyltransferase family 4 protein [Curtobacterium sp. ISL-83]
MRVLLVAVPLTARSGVYHSAIDLVRAARRAGDSWRCVLGLRPTASGVPVEDPDVTEYVVREHGGRILTRTRDLIGRHLDGVDVVITLIPQSDIAASSMSLPVAHVAWVRGLPWPGRSEQGRTKTALQLLLETRALRRADDVWATSPLLAHQVARARAAHVVQAGVPLLERSQDGATAGPLVWAGRLSVEKGPDVLVEIARRTAHPTVVFGAGPLAERIAAEAPDAVSIEPWASPADVWRRPGIALTTSHRDAFGRSPVEAASAGMPIVVSEQTGVAPMLFTDPDLAASFVLPLHDLDAWERAIRSLVSDVDLRRAVSDHVHANAQHLSIKASFDAARARLRTFTSDQALPDPLPNNPRTHADL